MLTKDKRGRRDTELETGGRVVRILLVYLYPIGRGSP